MEKETLEVICDGEIGCHPPFDGSVYASILYLSSGKIGFVVWLKSFVFTFRCRKLSRQISWPRANSRQLDANARVFINWLNHTRASVFVFVAFFLTGLDARVDPRTFTDNSFMRFSQFASITVYTFAISPSPPPPHPLSDVDSVSIYFIAFRSMRKRKTNSKSLIVFIEKSRARKTDFRYTYLLLLLLYLLRFFGWVSAHFVWLAISGPFVIFMRNADQRKL